MGGPFIWTNLNPLHKRMLCAKFGWNWPRYSGERFIKNFFTVFSPLGFYLPLGKGRALFFNKLESPSHMNALCQVGRYYPINFLKFSLRSFAIWLLFPLEKGPGLHLNKLEGYFVLSLVEIGLVVLEKILKFQQYISSLFRYYLPLGKGHGPSFELIWVSFTQ